MRYMGGKKELKSEKWDPLGITLSCSRVDKVDALIGNKRDKKPNEDGFSELPLVLP